MPSTLLELKSLKQKQMKTHQAGRLFQLPAEQTIRKKHQPSAYLSMSDRCFSKTNGFSESSEHCRETGGFSNGDSKRGN